MKNKEKQQQENGKLPLQNVIVSGYAIRFDEPDCNNNAIKANSFNPKDFEQMKIAGKMLDYEIDENGVKVVKRIDITSVSL